MSTPQYCLGDVRWEVQTKCVTFDPPPVVSSKSAMDEVEELAKRMHGLDITDAAYAGCYMHLAGLAPTAAQAWPILRMQCLVNSTIAQDPLTYLPLLPPSHPQSSEPSPTCFFCGGSHVMRNCSTAREYLQTGCIIWDGQYFAYPDKSHIHRFGNETFKQAIDFRYAIPITPVLTVKE
jgi:hypothetical protein